MPVVLGSTLFSHQADPPVHFRATGQLRRPTRQTGPASDASTWNKGTESRLLLRAVNTRLVEVTDMPQSSHDGAQGKSTGPLAATLAVPMGLVVTFLSRSPASLQRLLPSSSPGNFTSFFFHSYRAGIISSHAKTLINTTGRGTFAHRGHFWNEATL